MSKQLMIFRECNESEYFAACLIAIAASIEEVQNLMHQHKGEYTITSSEGNISFCGRLPVITEDSCPTVQGHYKNCEYQMNHLVLHTCLELDKDTPSCLVLYTTHDG